MSLVEPDKPFIQSRNVTRTERRDSAIRLLVLHTMENSEKPNSAEAVASWFASPDAPKASAHVCIDGDSLVQCVLPEHVAWAAPGANADGYHIEHAGRAGQGELGWDDDYSSQMLRRSARHAALACRRFGIPIQRLSVEQVRDKQARGFCGHIDVSHAFGKSDHTDPGPTFPWNRYLAMVLEAWEAVEYGDADTEPPPGAA